MSEDKFRRTFSGGSSAFASNAPSISRVQSSVFSGVSQTTHEFDLLTPSGSCIQETDYRTESDTFETFQTPSENTASISMTEHRRTPSSSYTAAQQETVISSPPPQIEERKTRIKQSVAPPKEVQLMEERAKQRKENRDKLNQMYEEKKRAKELEKQENERKKLEEEKQAKEEQKRKTREEKERVIPSISSIENKRRTR